MSSLLDGRRQAARERMVADADTVIDAARTASATAYHRAEAALRGATTSFQIESIAASFAVKVSKWREVFDASAR